MSTVRQIKKEQQEAKKMFQEVQQTQRMTSSSMSLKDAFKIARREEQRMMKTSITGELIPADDEPCLAANTTNANVSHTPLNTTEDLDAFFADPQGAAPPAVLCPPTPGGRNSDDDAVVAPPPQQPQHPTHADTTALDEEDPCSPTMVSRGAAYNALLPNNSDLQNTVQDGRRNAGTIGGQDCGDIDLGSQRVDVCHGGGVALHDEDEDDIVPGPRCPMVGATSTGCRDLSPAATPPMSLSPGAPSDRRFAKPTAALPTSPGLALVDQGSATASAAAVAAETATATAATAFATFSQRAEAPPLPVSGGGPPHAFAKDGKKSAKEKKPTASTMTASFLSKVGDVRKAKIDMVMRKIQQVGSGSGPTGTHDAVGAMPHGAVPAIGSDSQQVSTTVDAGLSPQMTQNHHTGLSDTATLSVTVGAGTGVGGVDAATVSQSGFLGGSMMAAPEGLASREVTMGAPAPSASQFFAPDDTDDALELILPETAPSNSTPPLSMDPAANKTGLLATGADLSLSNSTNASQQLPRAGYAVAAASGVEKDQRAGKKAQRSPKRGREGNAADGPAKGDSDADSDLDESEDGYIVDDGELDADRQLASARAKFAPGDSNSRLQRSNTAGPISAGDKELLQLLQVKEEPSAGEFLPQLPRAERTTSPLLISETSFPAPPPTAESDHADNEEVRAFSKKSRVEFPGSPVDPTPSSSPTDLHGHGKTGSGGSVSLGVTPTLLGSKTPSILTSGGSGSGSAISAFTAANSAAIGAAKSNSAIRDLSHAGRSKSSTLARATSSAGAKPQRAKSAIVVFDDDVDAEEEKRAIEAIKRKHALKRMDKHFNASMSKSPPQDFGNPVGASPPNPSLAGGTTAGSAIAGLKAASAAQKTAMGTASGLGARGRTSSLSPQMVTSMSPDAANFFPPPSVELLAGSPLLSGENSRGFGGGASMGGVPSSSSAANPNSRGTTAAAAASMSLPPNLAAAMAAAATAVSSGHGHGQGHSSHGVGASKGPGKVAPGLMTAHHHMTRQNSTFSRVVESVGASAADVAKLVKQNSFEASTAAAPVVFNGTGIPGTTNQSGGDNSQSMGIAQMKRTTSMKK